MGRIAKASAMGGCLLAIASLAGWLDISASVHAIAGGPATTASVYALVGLVCWTALAAVAAGLVGTWRVRQGAPARTRSPRRALALLIVGLITLATGLAVHRSGYSVCCSTSSSTQRAEELVH
jgi:hypothetical protein